MRYFLLVSLVFWLSSCAARYPMLEPLDRAWEFVDGKKVYTDTAAGMLASMAYDSYNPEYLSMLITTQNRSREPINFNPAGCSAWTTPASPEGLHIISAPDPERLLKQIDKDLRRAETAAAVAAILGAAATVTAVAVAASGPARSKSEYDRKASAFAGAQSVALASNLAEASSGTRIGRLVAQKQYFEAVLYRTQTLDSGEIQRGVLLLPRADYADTLEIRCPSGESELKFRFAQQMVKP